MNLETLRNDHKKIVDCIVKDPSGLNDFQKLPDNNGIQIDKVGIERFRIPLSFSHKSGQMLHDSEASMFVELASDKTGVNMSRFCTILQEESEAQPVSNDFFRKTLGRFRSDLRDSPDEDLISNSYLGIKFNYPVKQKSLKSDNWGWQYYRAELNGLESQDGRITMVLTLNYEYSSTCPCSLSMAKQYEDEYRAGDITEGSGIAVAHSQRSNAKVKVTYDLESDFFIHDLLDLIKIALPTETQSLVKRIDEQAFAILNGENPMFVEHSSRRLSKTLDSDDRILNWEAKVEHFESLHSHNAVAYIKKKGVSNGKRT